MSRKFLQDLEFLELTEPRSLHTWLLSPHTVNALSALGSMHWISSPKPGHLRLKGWKGTIPPVGSHSILQFLPGSGHLGQALDTHLPSPGTWGHVSHFLHLGNLMR